MVIRRGEIWWAELGPPRGSAPAYRRPVVILSGDDFNDSSIKTVIILVITSNLNLANMPGNLALPRSATGLPKASIANVTQMMTIDKSYLLKQVRMLPAEYVTQIELGLKLSLNLR